MIIKTVRNKIIAINYFGYFKIYRDLKEGGENDVLIAQKMLLIQLISSILAVLKFNSILRSKKKASQNKETFSR